MRIASTIQDLLEFLDGCGLVITDMDDVQNALKDYGCRLSSSIIITEKEKV